MKKKVLLGLLAVVMCFTLVGCGDKESTNDESGNSGTSGGSEQKENTVKTNWKNADVKEYELEDFAIMTNGVPEPKSNYKINSISTVSGFAFDLDDENAANDYLALIKDNGFTFKEEIYRMETYENNTHEIRFSGYSITIKLKD